MEFILRAAPSMLTSADDKATLNEKLIQKPEVESISFIFSYPTQLIKDREFVKESTEHFLKNKLDFKLQAGL